MSVLQIVATGAVLFLLYRFLLETIGVKKLGLWSLIMASTSVGQVANFGLTGSVVKFVAKYVALGEKDNVSDVVQTAIVSLAGFMGVISILSYPFLKVLLQYIVEKEMIELALLILPYALASFWLKILVSAFQSVLDGYQRIDIRSAILTVGVILNLLLCVMLVPRYDLMGVAYAKIFQLFLTLVALWIILRLRMFLPLIRWKWSKECFLEMFKFGLKFQAISITGMVYGPLTRALLSKFGDLSIVGYYEMASRLIQQFRALLVSANRALFPTIADLNERDPQKITSVYLASYKLLFYLALPMYSLLVILLPIISQYWIGHYEEVFVFMGTLLSIALGVNTLAAPAFIVNLGTGRLNCNLISRITIGCLNAALGLMLGAHFGGIGVVWAWGIAMVGGSSIIPLYYHKSNRVAISELWPKDIRPLTLICLAAVIIVITMRKIGNKDIFQLIIWCQILVVLVSVWFNPVRDQLRKWIFGAFVRTKSVM